MSLELPRVFSALYTPFDGEGEVDLPALRALCQRMVAAGVNLVPCGTTGETPTLTRAEQDLVIATAVEEAGGGVVLAGTGSNSTPVTIANTRRARELGAHMALVVTPYYNKPPQSCLLDHFRAVADEGGLPVVLYNVPGRAGCSLSLDTILQLAEHPQIIAIKEASADLDLIQGILAAGRDDFHVLSGDDAWTAPIVALGGHGVVSVATNVVPRAMVALVTAASQGDLSQMRRIQRRLLPLFDALFCTANPIPVKRAAQLLGEAEEHLRAPLAAHAMSAQMIDDLGRALDAARRLEGEL